MGNLEHLFFRKENALFNFRNLNGYTVQTTILRKKTASEEIGQRTRVVDRRWLAEIWQRAVIRPQESCNSDQ